MVTIEIDRERCDGCGSCVDFCPVDVLEVRGGTSVAVDIDACVVCRSCEVICPNDAIHPME